ncbi:MAG: helix-turn-helix transcriptional regulator [Anaerolineae bacterium]|nr:helix-turn-helix transcriptional regulator [Anaerolineae bacterium]
MPVNDSKHNDIGDGSDKQDAKKQLGLRVKRARLDMNLKQDELAAQMGISQAVVSNVENGLTTIDVPDLPRWASVLNKPIMYFYEDESADWQQRALDILRMFPENQIHFVLHMLRNMALSLHQVGDKE